MKRLLTIFAAFILTAMVCAPAGAELSGKDIVIKSKLATQAKSSINKVEMTLINKRGETLKQKMVSRAKTVQGLARSVTTFLYPDESKGTKFLMIENADRQDDMKLFIPDLKKVRAISSSQRNQSYMGTDFAYGDLEALSPDVGEHTLAGSEPVEGQDCYKVETILNSKEGAGYSKMINWIRKDNFVPVKTEYYDKDGGLKKVKTVHDLYKQGDIWVLKKMVMKDVQKDHQTVIEIVESKQSDVADSYFTEQFLTQTDKL